MKKKDREVEFRQRGLRKRAARQLARDVAGARAKGRSAPVSSSVIDDLDALIKSIRPIARRQTKAAVTRRAKASRPAASKKTSSRSTRGRSGVGKRR